jgi:hypothetical protein
MGHMHIINDGSRRKEAGAVATPKIIKIKKIISKILPIYTFANTKNSSKKIKKNNAPEHKNKLAFYCTFIKKFFLIPPLQVQNSGLYFTVPINQVIFPYKRFQVKRIMGNFSNYYNNLH